MLEFDLSLVNATLLQQTKNLDFPVAWNHETLIKDYIKKNTNSKYLKSPDKGSFDEQVIKAVSES